MHHNTILKEKKNDSLVDYLAKSNFFAKNIKNVWSPNNELVVQIMKKEKRSRCQLHELQPIIIVIGSCHKKRK